jgi:hypothetical protein
MYSGFMRAACVAAALGLLWPDPAAAQAAASATVTGVVRDASDAVVQGAVVRVRNHETNQTVDTTTDAQGRYRLLYVPVGDYHLSVEAPGFATASVNLTLSVGAAVDVPVVLKPAAVIQSVEVVTPAPSSRCRAPRLRPP